MMQIQIEAPIYVLILGGVKRSWESCRKLHTIPKWTNVDQHLIQRCSPKKNKWVDEVGARQTLDYVKRQ